MAWDILDPFGEGEKKRLNYELNQADEKNRELMRENSYLRGQNISLSTALDSLTKQFVAMAAEQKTMKAENEKLAQALMESERVRKKLCSRDGAA